MRLFTFFFVIVFACVTYAAAQPPTAKQAFELGTKSARTAQYEKAIEYYRKASALSEPKQSKNAFLAGIHYNSGVCLYQLKRLDEAIAEFKRTIELTNGDYQKAFYALGMAQSDLKDWKNAETSFRALLNLKNEDAEAWFDLALVLLEEKEFDAAQSAFRNAIRYKSIAAPDAHNNLGVILALKGDISSAENEFEIALRQSGGKSVEARNNLQFCKSYRENYSQNLAAKFEFSQL